MKTFKRIPQSNHSYLLICTYAKNSSFHLTYVYNNISGGYMGTQIECFIETIRGIQNTIPNFFEEFDDSNPVKSLKYLGFEEVEATELEFKMYAE